MNGALHASRDASAVDAAAAGDTAPHPNWVLATTILASSLAFIDGSVVNVGLPALVRTFQASGADLQWMLNAYLLPLSALPGARSIDPAIH